MTPLLRAVLAALDLSCDPARRVDALRALDALVRTRDLQSLSRELLVSCGDSDGMGPWEERSRAWELFCAARALRTSLACDEPTNSTPSPWTPPTRGRLRLVGSSRVSDTNKGRRR